MVKVISVVPGVDTVYGSTVTVTLERGQATVTCANMLTRSWSTTQADDYLFDAWVERATYGEEDFTYNAAAEQSV